MSKHILLIQGHSDAGQLHLCHALEDAYAQGATAAGHMIKLINVATLDLPILRSRHEWEQGNLPHSLKEAQQDIKWADHLLLFFPLLLGDMPAMLKGFLEQVVQPSLHSRARARIHWLRRRSPGDWHASSSPWVCLH